MKLLLVDDEPGIIIALYRALGDTHDIDVAATGKKALQKIKSHTYDAIVLDLNLPDISGLEVCEQTRSIDTDTPILVLSGVGEAVSKVTLLDSGANDYLTKPFDIDELQARIRAITRSRPHSRKERTRLVVGDLVLNTTTKEVSRAGVPINLRRKEFAILECLMQNAGQVLTRELLMAHVWDEVPDTAGNSLHVHINYLRDKVDRPFSVPLIRTVHGFGYKIDASKLVAHKTKVKEKQ